MAFVTLMSRNNLRGSSLDIYKGSIAPGVPKKVLRLINNFYFNFDFKFFLFKVGVK